MSCSKGVQKLRLPKVDDLNKVGTACSQILAGFEKVPDGNITAVIRGRKRLAIGREYFTEPYYMARIKEITSS